MALRLIEFAIDGETDVQCAQLLAEQQVLGVWQEQLSDGRTLVRILVDAQHSEGVIDLVEEHFSAADGFRLMIFPIEATLPRPDPPEEQEEQQQKEADDNGKPAHDRISREELYEDISTGAEISWVYFVFVVLSTIVAGIGLVRNDVAVIIGAMVIAPLLGPNISLALATTLGDVKLMSQSLKANAVGLATALVLAVLLGYVFDVDPKTSAIASRTEISLQHILLALASGSAGALAFTRGAPATLIGVMVAVALLPPLVVCGMLLGSEYTGQAFSAALLVLANVICVNLAGVITFLAQGIRPRSWWEAERAKKAARIAIALWVTLLAVLVAVVLFASEA